MEEENITHNKTLAMRIRQIANRETSKTTDAKRMQYYVSSAVMQPKNTDEPSNAEKPDIYQTAYPKLQNDRQLTQDEKTFLQQSNSVAYERTAPTELEMENLIQKLQNCKTKQDVKQAENFHLNLIRSWCALAENNKSLSAEQKIEYTLLKDATVSAIQNTVRTFMESEKYQSLPSKIESAPEENKCVKAKNKYENFSKSLQEQQAADNGTLFSLDMKG